MLALSAQTLLRRVLLGPAWVGLGAVLLLSLAAVTLPPAVLYAPFLASFVLLGLPHGAVDHRVLQRMPLFGLRRWPLAGLIAAYVGIAALYLLGWWMAPLPAFALFIGLTWFHWGQGDLHALRAVHGVPYLDARGLQVLAVVVRGGLPMLVPLLAFPAVYGEVAGWTTGVIDPSAAAAFDVLLAADVRTALGVAFGLLVAVYLVASWTAAAAAGRRLWAGDAFEVGLLAAFFALVHPVLAVGLYFCLWHSARHVARLLLADPATGSARPTQALATALRRFARQAVPTTLAALALLGGLYLLVPTTPTTLPELLGLYLVLIAVLTLPHVVVVCLMDAEEGVWQPAPGWTEPAAH